MPFLDQISEFRTVQIENFAPKFIGIYLRHDPCAMTPARHDLCAMSHYLTIIN